MFGKLGKSKVENEASALKQLNLLSVLFSKTDHRIATMKVHYSSIVVGLLVSRLQMGEAETRCEEVVDPEIQIGVDQPGGNVIISEDSYRIWADGSNVENNARAYCIQTRLLLDGIRMESYRIGCEGEPDTPYADHREEYALNTLGSFEGRLSGSSGSACYNLFTMIECCWETSNWCFPPDAAVNVQGKGSTAMKDLRVGDNVQVSSDGVFEPLYSIAHESHDPANFLKIQTRNGALEISENHMLFTEGSSKPVMAKNVNLGDSLMGDGGRRKSNISRK